MSIDETTPETASDSSTEAGLTDEQRNAIAEATTHRRNGSPRPAVVGVLVSSGMDERVADVMVDGMDEINALTSGVQPADMSDRAKAKAAEIATKLAGVAKPALTRKPEVLMNDATKMAAQGKSNVEIVKHLTSHGVSNEEATKVSTRIGREIGAARSTFNASRRKAMNSAGWKIGLGILIVVVGLFLMASGAESSGRRTPLGAVIGGGIMLASGIKEYSSVQSQSFEQRVRSAYR